MGCGAICGSTREADGEEVLGLTLISVAVGLLLAVGYHLLAGRFQAWARRSKAAAAPAAVVLGFLVRITIIAAVLIVIGLTTSLNMLALGLAFVGLFTVLNIWSIYRLLSKNPPSARPTGTNP